MHHGRVVVTIGATAATGVSDVTAWLGPPNSDVLI